MYYSFPFSLLTEMDLIPYCLTFFLGLFVSVEIGMIAGTLAHLAILVYFASRPKVVIQDQKVVMKEENCAFCFDLPSSLVSSFFSD